MKYILVLLLITSTGLAHSSMDEINRLSSALCEYIKNDDRTSIRKKLRSANLDLRKTYTGFVCQPEGDFKGGSLLRTATYFGASQVSTFLIRKMERSDIAFKEHDGKTTVEWAKEAVESGAVKNADKAKSIYAEMESRSAD
ncbi:DUF3718 domain-containing protein [Pleionea mediterranea]|uniref:Uncharacterized protein DUF3718 n=1 Tax=Pleionea mediterranea TaxID=523701 RepID=A0A316FND4_9GAMM|nr:DUF3718 domain-containing protein [Pleionea mediterranea]PWK49196.1 uncharacterized protein DUF3718 [Pleionea mediterranea]